MISRDEVVPLLVAACPGFQRAWQEHLSYWGQQERGVFIDTSEWARYIVECFGQNDTSEFESAFSTVERILDEGDDDARGIATVGALESIQVISSHRPFGSDAFVPWLGPKSRVAWAEIASIWEAGGGTLAGVIRLERGDDVE